MDDPPKTYFVTDKAVVVAGSGQKKPAKQKQRNIDRKLGAIAPDFDASASRSAPALGVGKEDTKPRGARLYERYGLVYDPEAEQNPITQAERDALTDLYTEVTGRDITLEDDTLSALERHNLIMRRSRKRRAIQRLAGSDDIPEFASAADALDWLRTHKPPEGYTLGKHFEKAFAPVADSAAKGLSNFAKGVEFVGDQIERASDAVEPIRGLPKPSIGYTIDPFDASQSRIWLKTEPKTIGENVEGVARPIGGLAAEGLDKAVEGLSKIGDAPVTLYGTGFSVAPGGQPGGIQRTIPTRPAPRDRLKSGAPSMRLKDVVSASQELAESPNDVVNVASDVDTYLEDADPRINAASKGARQGMRMEQIEGLLVQGPDEQNAASIFSPNVDMSMRAFAKINGWDDSEWDNLTPAEKLFRGNTKNQPLLIGLRNVARAVGETGATPASIKFVADATAGMLRGDTTEAEAMITAAFRPFARWREIQKKRGVWAATAQFAQEDPTYFALIANAAMRSASRGVGAVARARGVESVVPGQVVTAKGAPIWTPPTPKPDPVFEPRPGAQVIADLMRLPEERARVREENAQRRAAWDAADTKEEQIAAGEVFQPEFPVGVTTGAAFNDLVVLKLRKKIAERSNRFSRMYASRLVDKAAERYSRRELNAVQGVALEMAGIMERELARQEGKRLRRPVDEWTKNRAAFNLSWAGETLDGTPVTPGLVADYFKAEQAELRASLGDAKPKGNDKAQLAYWEAQEKFFRRLDEVEIPEETMARLRAAAKPLGEANDKIIAAALGISVKEARRANYIRLLVIDPKFEARAQARKRMVNLEPLELQIAQRNIKRLSDQMQEYLPESSRGTWGAKGPTATRRRFAQVREQLIAEMQSAQRLAESLGDDELARVLADGLAKMRLARSAASMRATDLQRTFDALDELKLSDEQVRALSPEGRAAYESAQSAEQDVVRLRGEQQAALDELGVKRTTGATVQAAQRKLSAARDELARLQGFRTPDAAAIERARKKVVDAEERLARVEAAQSTKEPLRVAELSRDQQVREAKRIINAGRPIIDDGELAIARDVSGDLAAVRIRTRKDFAYYTIERARNETIDEFIARVEAQQKNPVLHLVQTRAFERLGDFAMVEGGRRLRGDTMARVRPGRLKSSEGYTFARGYEDPSMWRNLMFDTSELASSELWSGKVTDLLDATSPRFTFNAETLARAQEIAKTLTPDDSDVGVQSRALSDALSEFINAESVYVDMREYVVIPPKAPNAARPSERFDIGARRQMEPESLGELTIRELTERDIDASAPGDYYLVPRSVYDGIMKAVEDESFRFRPPRDGWRRATSGWQYRLDKWTRAWRTLTLNVFPRTAAVNTIGSGILAIQAGAGPRSMQYAAMAILGIEMKMPDGSMRRLPVPAELRQRYYEQQLTDPLTASRMRLDQLPDPNARDAAFAWAAWYMNSIRHVNGMSEDLGRLAVWYSKAYPEAMRAADGHRFFLSARSLTHGALDLLDDMARGDGAWRVKHQAWMQQSFDFLGDLHKGGAFASRMRIAIPFWQWYWHMLKLQFFTMPLKYPKRALFLQMLGDIGAQYQEEHGVVVPWAWGFIPFMTYNDKIDGASQLVTAGVDVGTVYPQNQWGQYMYRNGEVNLGKAVQDSVNPLMSNLSLIIWSAIPGTDTVEFDDRGFVRAAKDEFGINVGGPTDSQFWNYVANKVFRMVPLSPSLMSSMGRASTAFPYPGQMSERYRSEDSVVRPNDLNTRADVTDLDFDWRSWAKFLSKIIVGVRYDEIDGIGPVWQRQLQIEADRFARQKTEQERKMAEIMRRAFDGE